MGNIRLEILPPTTDGVDASNLVWVERDSGGGLYTSERTIAGLLRQPAYASKADGFTASSGDHIEPDNSSSDCTINLPSSPATGAKVYFSQKYNQPFSAFNLTIGRNGNTIGGLSEDMVVDTNNQSFYLLYNGTTWVPIKEQVIGTTTVL